MRPVFILLALFLTVSSSAQFSDTFQINFGDPAVQGDWSSYGSPRTPARIPTFSSRRGCSEGDLYLVRGFNGINRNGPTSTTTTMRMSSDITGTSFFGNTEEFAGLVVDTAELMLDVSYIDDLPTDESDITFEFFAGRQATDNRQTCYTVFADDTTTICINAAGNTSEIAKIETQYANTDTIRIIVTAGQENDNPFGFFYLSALKVYGSNLLSYSTTTEEVPLVFTTPVPGSYVRGGSDIEITYNSGTVCRGILQYQKNSQSDWITIDSQFIARNGQYRWSVPAIEASDSQLRVNIPGPRPHWSTNFYSPRFQIGTDTTPCRIVVIGSSTAAGTGPSTLDSAWVWRLRNEYTPADGRREIINLARGGYNTFKLLPDDATIPAGINQTIDSARNISQAMRLNPEVIIINLPSNDAASGYDVATQLANYDQIISAAGNIPVFVTTPQPRNFGANQIAIQRELLDSTFSIFGERTLDFWTPFAEPNGTVNPDFDSGDGVHLNDAAHRIMLNTVLEKQLDTLLSCKRASSLFEGPGRINVQNITLAPNPSKEGTTAQFDFPAGLTIEYIVVDQLGRQVQEGNFQSIEGQQELFLSQKDRSAGLYNVFIYSKQAVQQHVAHASWLVLE